MKFEPMRKIRRDPLSMYVTEKLDGTNTSVHIYDPKVNDNDLMLMEMPYEPTAIVDGLRIYTAFRKRWIAPGEDNPGIESDNFGFAKWVKDNAEEIVKLGSGSHFGEWVGPGIQKNPHQLDEKRFYLFNHYRWHNAYKATLEGHDTDFPKCAHVVPHLSTHVYSQYIIDALMDDLSRGSKVGGKAEGIMIYIPDADHYQKVTFEHSQGKWNSDV